MICSFLNLSDPSVRPSQSVCCRLGNALLRLWYTAHNSMASVGLLASGVTCGRPAAELHARLVSSSSATCSYTVSVTRPRPRRAAVTCRAAQTEVAESPEAPEELSDDILDLLGPRTRPTPVLDPQEVSPLVCLSHLAPFRCLLLHADPCL